MKKQQGFTLIELIIVIVVLGILAVTAAPQFIDFSSDARTSTVNGAKGAMQGASQVTYAKAALEDSLGATGTANGVDTVFGYPAATAAGIIAATNMDAEAVADGAAATAEWAYFVDATTTPESLLLAPGDLVTGSATAAATDISGTNCFVTYSQAADASTPATVVVTDSGC
ncbi:MSHA pilin protein MshA [Pseudidiomarina planktonica]|uniref:MSHA pilin protein MshA n=1 Tax=Pseudidiomarina planktonica TaxID=1323738 RepID=A0A1Y6ECQ8_9GAMM|nr:type II secretion system protein [Pseudidiomarina planktonica]RUO66119.1 type II secretion system protein [Pseudidiomarina planktonica]SMQ60325.1 MSHA pilin protein MshA [Pseudidiomarina planktonica]